MPKFNSTRQASKEVAISGETSRYGSPEELMALVDEYLDGLDANCHPPTNRAEPHDNAGWFATPSRYNIRDLESHVAAYFKADLDDFNEHVPVLALKVLARYAIMAREKCDIIKDLEASVTQRDAEIEELREEVVGEMAVTLKRSVSLQKASDEVARLREELNNVRHDNKVLIGLIERLREELNNVRHNNKVLTARADSLGELLLASEESVQNRNKRIEELREERDAARAVCKEQADALEELAWVPYDEKLTTVIEGVEASVKALRATLGKDGEICGAGRVTKRVAREMTSGGLMESDAPPTEAPERVWCWNDSISGNNVWSGDSSFDDDETTEYIHIAAHNRLIRQALEAAAERMIDAYEETEEMDITYAHAHIRAAILGES